MRETDTDHTTPDPTRRKLFTAGAALAIVAANASPALALTSPVAALAEAFAGKAADWKLTLDDMNALAHAAVLVATPTDLPALRAMHGWRGVAGDGAVYRLDGHVREMLAERVLA